jgi:hypothetical protein
MSADNSPRSDSSQNRYQRAAADQKPATATAEPNARPNERQREATRRQAEDDRRKRGQARKIDEVSALFGSPGAPEVSGDDAAAHGKTESDDSAGRGSAPPSDRPALELDEDERDEGEGQKKRKKQKTVVDFAAEHEIEPKAIYELAVPLEAGQEPVTVAALKDHYKATRDFETKRDEFEDWQQHAQGEVIQARSQLDDVVMRLTSVVPPDVLARAFTDMQADSTAALEKARGQLSEWFPEWSDVQVKIRDRTRLEEVLATYGFNKFEIGAVRDARLIKFAMDAIRKGDRYDRLKAGTREKIPSKEPTSQRKPRQPNATDQAREIAKKGDIVGGVVKLLGG